MEILYRHGGATAAEVHAELPSPPSYSATRAMLAGLLRKGHIKHRSEGGKYVYQPKKARARAAASAINSILDTFFDGSASAAIAGILATNQRKISREEAERLNELIERAAENDSARRRGNR